VAAYFAMEQRRARRTSSSPLSKHATTLMVWRSL
jgi:hypothetical protein